MKLNDDEYDDDDFYDDDFEDDDFDEKPHRSIFGNKNLSNTPMFTLLSYAVPFLHKVILKLKTYLLIRKLNLIISGTKDSSAYTHHSRAFFDRNFVIIGHPH